MKRGVPNSSLAVAAAVVLLGCFRGGFLDDTCEQRPGACGQSTGVASTSTTSPPTTDASSSMSADASSSSSSGAPDTTTGAPGLLIEGPAFRVSAIEIVDPPLYLKAGLCADASNFVNGGLTAAVETYDTNVILVAQEYDSEAATQEFWFYPSADCPPGEGYCVLNPALKPTVFVAVNREMGDCGGADATTLNPTNLGFLHVPVAPCVLSPTASLPLKLSEDLPEIGFLLGKFAAEYRPDAAAPTRLDHATLQGFVPETDAEMIDYIFMGQKVNLWSVIRGSDHPDACPVPMDGEPGSVSDVDMVDVDGPDKPGLPIRGVFLYMNFTAKKIDVYAPL